MVAAAAKVFARRGYHGASTQDIADVLGIRQASLYYYFESKEAALEAVCADGVADYAVRARAILRGPGSAADKVAQLVFQHLAPLAERLDFTLAFLRERRFLPAPARKRIRAIERRYERIIERVIEQGIASGRVPRRPRSAHGDAGAARPRQLRRRLVRTRARRDARAHHLRTTSTCWCAPSARAARRRCA